jgi:hypothetical protein
MPTAYGIQPTIMIRVADLGEHVTVVIVDGKEYSIREDEATGDFLVTCNEDPLDQGDWMNDKHSAVNYALYRDGAVDEADYERAPTRCDA